MKVQVRFYSQLRDLAEIDELHLDLPANSTVQDLLRTLYQRFPALGPHDKTILVGAGVEFVDRDYKLKPGDDISVMPPVQGG